MQKIQIRDGFGSKLGAILALAGSAVGLGNIWKFPYEVGTNGGAAFLFVYIGFTILLGMPVMLSEFIIGRRSQSNPFGAFKKLAPKTAWKNFGFLSIITAIIILAFYSTVAGWTLEYVVEAISNSFHTMTSKELENHYKTFITHSYKPILYQLIFMLCTSLIILAGVRKGIEKYTKLLMPLLFLLIVAMCIRSVTLEGASEGLKFLFSPDFSKLTGATILSALGQAFFSLSIGMGVVLTYASYINKKENLVNISIQVIIADTLIAILAGIAIFPAVFAFNIDPASGPGLVFLTLPKVFQHMPGGYFWGITFFVLLTVAALTSAISLLEVVVAYLTEEKGFNRKKATLYTSLGITAVGVVCTLSFGPLKDLTLFDKTVFEIFDFLSSKILLPLGGIIICFFIGWKMNKKDVYDEISNSGTLKIKMFKVFIFIIKYIAPICILAIFISELL
jgi:NSS family neurotransmitter:Na+ symporter